MNARVRTRRRAQSAATAFVCQLLLTTAVHAAPPIRTSENNRVPSCVSPERLMAFLRDRNEGLDPRYRDIARWYKYYGEAWKVRWDYAFFQMVLETNYLKYRRADGRRGDVHERQNNFAGIGATGGGVAGERFADVKTGVHAQIQHLVAYSGERVHEPVAKRTGENQDDIIAKSRGLGRAVTFGDLARRWAADRAYARSIDVVAKLFNDGYCKGPATAGISPPPRPEPVRRLEHPSGLGGPKPQHQPGEEVLPWADGSLAENRTSSGKPTGIDTPPANEPAHKPIPPADALAKQTPPPAGHSGHPPVRTLWSREDGKPQNASVRSSQSVELPYFRIAPADPGPSRLGGPVDAAQNARDARPIDARMSVASLPAPGPDAQPSAAGQASGPRDCHIVSASYGGSKTLLVQADAAGSMQLTALTVLDGFEDSMLASYAKARAPGARVIGTYQNKDDALSEARTICPPG